MRCFFFRFSDVFFSFFLFFIFFPRFPNAGIAVLNTVDEGKRAGGELKLPRGRHLFFSTTVFDRCAIFQVELQIEISIK